MSHSSDEFSLSPQFSLFSPEFSSFHFSLGNPAVEPIKGSLALGPPGASSARTVCLFDLPCHLSLHEFHEFLSDSPFFPLVAHALVLRPQGNGGFFACLVQFPSSDKATEFAAAYDRRRFNSLEPEFCRCFLVESLSFDDGKFEFPPAVEANQNALEGPPCCPVCLDALASSGPLITILCGHSFHFDCLANWRDLKCPVCRYCMKPAQTTSCQECGSHCTEGLWLCVVCGHIGCSRYAAGHAESHYHSTGHAYALDMISPSQRVWDYVTDQFVHRLVTEKQHGELVEISSNRSKESGKLEALAVEFNYLLSAQLENQRKSFKAAREEKRAELEEKRASRAAALSESTRAIEKLQQRCDSTEAAIKRHRLARSDLRPQLENLQAENARLQEISELRSSQRSSERLRLAGELVERRAFKADLLRAAQARVRESEETLADLTAHLQIIKKTAKSPMRHELQSGAISLSLQANEQKIPQTRTRPERRQRKG